MILFKLRAPLSAEGFLGREGLRIRKGKQETILELESEPDVVNLQASSHTLIH